MLQVVYCSCVPNTDSSVTYSASIALHPYNAAVLIGSLFGLGLRLLAKSDVTIGSKTCIGLTYLKLTLLNIQWLQRVSGG